MQRVLKTLPKFHPDFKRARQELSSIFGKLQNETPFYKSKQEFASALEDWLELYSNPTQLSKLNDLEKIKLIGCYCFYVIDNNRLQTWFQKAIKGYPENPKGAS